MADARNRLAVLREIEALEKKIADFRAKNDMRTTKAKKEIVKLTGDLLELEKESANLRDKGLEALASQEKSIGNISNSFADFKNAQKEVFDISRSMTELGEEELEQIGSVLETSRQISDLNIEDEAQLEALTNQYEKQLSALGDIEGISDEIIEKIKEQNKEATSLAKKTEDEKNALKRSDDAADELKKTFQAFSENIETAVTHLNSVEGRAGMILFAFGEILERVFETNKEFGMVGQGLTKITAQATFLEVLLEGSREAASELSANLGGTEEVSLRLNLATAAIANNMGISASESAGLVTSFMLLNKGSEDTALNLIKSSQQLAIQNGIIPAQLMADLAKSTEEFALFGEDGGENIVRAAAFARKLGVEISQIAGVAENLLDFESSISKELELSAMLGRNINLQKARQLAFDNDLEGATKEVLKQIGGINEFEKMNFFQRKQTADLLGVTTAELQKMLTNQEKGNSLSKMGSENFSAMGETVANLAGNFIPKLAKGLAGIAFLISLAGGVKGGIGGVFQNIGKGVTSMGGAVTNAATSTSKALSSVGTGISSFFKSMAVGLKALANPKVLIGLAAVTLAFIGIGFALGQAAPAIEAFGSLIASALSGVASIVQVVFGGLTDMLSVVTLEKAAAISLLGIGFLGLAAGITALGIAAFFGGGTVGKFLQNIGELDTGRLQQNATAVKNFAQGLATLNQGINNLDTEKLEKLEEASISLSVGAAISNIGGSVSGLIESATGALFGDDGGNNTQELMLAELVAIKEQLAVPKVVQIDREKAGQVLAKSTDSSARNVSSMDG